MVALPGWRPPEYFEVKYACRDPHGGGVPRSSQTLTFPGRSTCAYSSVRSRPGVTAGSSCTSSLRVRGFRAGCG